MKELNLGQACSNKNEDPIELLTKGNVLILAATERHRALPQYQQ